MSQADSALAVLLRRQLQALQVFRTQFKQLQQCARTPAYMLGGGFGRELHAFQQILEGGERARIWRAVYVRNFWATCPDDVLRCIFEAALDSDPPSTFGVGEYDPWRTSLPFSIAAVCLRWRRVALASPRLWTYAVLPPPEALGSNPAAHLDRLKLLLSRSRCCRLDVVVHDEWKLGAAYDLLPVDHRYVLRSSVLALAEHSNRWRMAHIWLPCDAPAELLDFLGSTMPWLRHLSVAVERIATANTHLPARGYLAHAPQLRDLEVALPGPNEMDTCRGSMPLLHTLRIWHACSNTDAGRLLLLFGASLRSLDLQTWAPGDCENSCTSLDLPALTSLCLRGVPFFQAWSKDRFSLPKLTTLSLHVDAVLDCIVPFLDAASPTVTHLELFGTFPDTALLLSIVGHLRRITHLTLAPRLPFEEPCNISDKFFVELADAVPCVWPRLTSVRLDEEAVVSGGAQGMVHLLARRNSLPTGQSESKNVEVPVPIREVVLHADQTTASVANEIARLVAVKV